MQTRFLLSKTVFVIGLSLIISLSFSPLDAGVTLQQATPAAPPDFIEGEYWALIIGIDKYPSLGKDKQLSVARKDAEAVAMLLKERYGFEKDRIVELYDEAATRKGIIKAFSSMTKRLSNKDSFFIYFAGHGDLAKPVGEQPKKEIAEDQSYWLPSNAAADDPSSFIFDSEVIGFVEVMGARHIYMVVDSALSARLLGRSRALGMGAIKELYQEKSRSALVSGGRYPVEAAADRNKNGHSVFAGHFLKILRQNTERYLLAKDIAEAIAVRVSSEVKGMLPRGAPLVGTGDEGGQFVFRLQKEFVGKPDAPSSAISQEVAPESGADFEKKKKEMLERLKKLEEEKQRLKMEEEKVK